jgi:HTH-type transcriptional regulator / antitoxin MqsA
MKCPTCRIGNLVVATRKLPYRYKGKSTVIKAVKGKFCNNLKCREAVLDIDEAARVSKEMLAFNKEVNRELTPIDLLARVRERFKLNQQQAAKIFGGGTNAFSRYESGKTKPPVALIKLFKVLDKHPDLFKEIVRMDTGMGLSNSRREGGIAESKTRVSAPRRKRRAPPRLANA